jgi:CBS domain-containing protein
MNASQAMTRPVVTVPADATVFAAADILLGSRISAAPVIDADGKLVGIVSEADLMNRPEVGTVPAKSWLQRLLADDALLARDYVRSHSHRVADVMTREVISAEERTQLAEIAKLMQRHRIKRVPIVRDGKIIGIVSRGNLLQGLLAREPHPADGADDANVRTSVHAELAKHSWGSGVTNVVVDQGVVHLWGYVASAPSKEAARVAAENIPGVRRVVNNIVVPSDVYLPS